MHTLKVYTGRIDKNAYLYKNEPHVYKLRQEDTIGYNNICVYKYETRKVGSICLPKQCRVIIHKILQHHYKLLRYMNCNITV